MYFQLFFFYVFNCIAYSILLQSSVECFAYLNLYEHFNACIFKFAPKKLLIVISLWQINLYYSTYSLTDALVSQISLINIYLLKCFRKYLEFGHNGCSELLNIINECFIMGQAHDSNHENPGVFSNS